MGDVAVELAGTILGFCGLAPMSPWRCDLGLFGRAEPPWAHPLVKSQQGGSPASRSDSTLSLGKNLLDSPRRLSDNAHVPSLFGKITRVFVPPLCVLGAAVTLVSVIDFFAPSWHQQLIDLLGRTWSNVRSSISYTNLGIAIFVFAFPTLRALVSATFSGRFREVVLTELKKSVAPDLVVGISILAVLFGWSLTRTVHDDHQAMAEANKNVTDENTRLKKENEKLKNVPPPAPKTVVREVEKPVPVQVAQQTKIVAFMVPRQDIPDAAKKFFLLEYVVTTNVPRESPIQLIADCNLPIADALWFPLTGSFEVYQQGSSDRISPARYQFSVVSPQWSPALPLKVEFFFDRPRAIPSCSFSSP